MTGQLQAQCTVCGRHLTVNREYGRRHYCDEHLTGFALDVPAFWQASALTFGVMAILTAATGITGSVLAETLAGTPSMILSMGLALLPGLIWLGLLFRIAARHGTPVSPLLPTLFILGALLAAAATRPLLYDLIGVPGWLARTTASNRLSGNILLNGFMTAFALYAIVRYTVWRTPAFSHRVDGPMFAVAAAWGYGSMFALLFVLDQEQIALLNGGLRIIVILCAYITPGFILGFFLGRNRFEDMPIYYLTSGVSLAAVINGFLLYAGVELNNVSPSISNDGYSPWPGIAISTVTLAATFAAVLGLISRHNSLTRGRLEGKEA